MIKHSAQAESDGLLRAADAMCVAARTAPKAKGIDSLDSCVVSGDDLETLAAEMERLAAELDYGFFIRDAACVRRSGAVVLIGAKLEGSRGLGEGCSICGFNGCADAKANGAVCAHILIDLGIALGSAAAIAADSRLDSRIMFSVGKAAKSLGILENCDEVLAIPVSVTGKSPYFDRAPRK